MNDIIFERPGWELLLDSLRPGESLSAVRLLSILEAEDEDVVEEALDVLTQRKIAIDVSSLPCDYGSGDMEKRLRFEEELVRSGMVLSRLEENDSLRLYLEELAATPAQGDPCVLSQRLLEGEESAGQLLLNLYLHRVVETAGAYTGRGVLMLDMMQEAALGLWQAILEYSEGDLEAQINWWIRQSIARVILLQARESGVLHNMQKSMEAYQKADKQLLVELGRNATNEEIALELGMTPDQADVVRDMVLNASAMEKVKMAPKEQDPEEQQAVEDTAYFQSRQRIDELLSGLSEPEVQVLSLRFGLDGNAPMTAEAVGNALGMTAGQVVAVEAAALEKLRKS